MRQNAVIVIITGGLGPTSDDITKPLLAKFSDSKMVTDAETLQHLKKYFAQHGKPLIDINIAQALVPHNCKVLHNKMGTAPGMLFETTGYVLISLPGVPLEMQHVMEIHVLPYIKK